MTNQQTKPICSPQVFSFVPILPKRRGSSQEPNLIVGKTRCYISAAFFQKYGSNFAKVRVLWDEQTKTVGLHFHSSANRVPDSFVLQGYPLTETKSFSCKVLRDRIHLACGKKMFVAEIEPAPQEGPDFFIVHLKSEKEE
jgi:hypothetical protein